MDLQATMRDAARHRVVPTRAPPTSASQWQPRPQQLGRRCLPPRPPPPSRGETTRSGGGVGKPDELLRGAARGTRHGIGVATRDAAAVAAAAGDAAPGVARADSGKGKGVAEFGGERCLDSAEEKGGGDTGRKRGVGLAAFPPAPPPPPKRRLVLSATRRSAPGCGRDAAAPRDDDSKPVVARADGASGAQQKKAAPPAHSVGKVGSSVMQVESPAHVVSAPIADSDHHGLEYEQQRSSEPLRHDGVPSADGLLDANSQGDAGFVRKELVPATPTRRLLPKPRMVSAVRHFPPGCGRPRASLVAREGNTEVRLPLPEKAVFTDCSTSAADKQAMQIAAVPCNATITDRAARKENFVKGKIATPMLEPQGSHSRSNVALHESAACRDGPSVPAISLRSQEKRPSCLEAELQRSSETSRQGGDPSAAGLLDTDSQGDAGSAGFGRKELVPATLRLLPKPRTVSAVRRFPPGCGRPRASLVAGGCALAQSLAAGPSKEHLVSTKMGRAISGVALGASGGQGAMRRDKVMSGTRKEVGPAKSIQKSAPGSHPRLVIKIKKRTEHGRCVITNGSKEDIARSAKHRIVQASTSENKCPQADREAAATSRNSFGPKKGNVKQKSMLPSNVEDDIMKALAAHEEKYGVQNVDARSKVKMMRGRFEFIRRAIIQAVKQYSLKLPRNRVDLGAADLIKKTQGFTQHGPIVGKVPGIEVGDEFLYRVELNIVGLHRPYQGGIDTTRDKYNELIAISVVASGGYPDELSRSGELVYTGSGGKISGMKGVGDQKLEKGNLALKNCIRTKTPVRVIHRFKSLSRGKDNHSRAKENPMFTYDGLYNVVECWREGQPGSEVLKYKLQRIHGQDEPRYGS